jgi:hypothetical protein
VADKRSWRKDDFPCCVCDQDDVFVSSKYVLHFDLARLAVDRHLHGGSRGIPLDLLARRIPPQHSGIFFRSATETWEARIIDGHLFLSSNRWVETVDGAEHYPWFLKLDDYFICQHLRFSFGIEVGPREVRSVEHHLLLTGGEFQASCPCCLTDFRFDKKVDAKTAKLTTFHCLGTCRSPDDWIWRSSSQTTQPANMEPIAIAAPPRARKSWVLGALVCEPFTLHKQPVSPYDDVILAIAQPPE